MISGNSGLIHKQLEHNLSRTGLAPVDAGTPGARPSVLWVEPINNVYSRKCFDVVCGIKNLLHDDKDAIRKKSKLYVGMKAMFPDETRRFMAETLPCTRDYFASFGSSDVVIVKPVNGFSGKGISIVEAPTPRTLEQARARAAQAVPRSDVIMCRYVRDPMLWSKKKFHIRVYMLAAVVHGAYRTHVWDEGEVFTAAQPYEDADYGDEAIHDTHGRSTLGDLSFPRDMPVGGVSLETCAAVMASVRGVLACVSAVLQPHARPYRESRHAFEVFAADFLVRRDGTPVLLEINDKVGFGFNTPAHATRFSAAFFDWVHTAVLAPVLAGAAPPVPLFPPPMPAAKLPHTAEPTPEPAAELAHTADATVEPGHAEPAAEPRDAPGVRVGTTEPAAPPDPLSERAAPVSRKRGADGSPERDDASAVRRARCAGPDAD